MADKTKNLKPFKPGYDPRRHKKQKGEISFKTAFEKAVKYVAEHTKKEIGVEDTIYKIIATAIIKAGNGNYSFYKDLMDRLFGQAKQQIEIKEKPLLVLDVLNTEDIKKSKSDKGKK